MTASKGGSVHRICLGLGLYPLSQSVPVFSSEEPLSGLCRTWELGKIQDSPLHPSPKSYAQVRTRSCGVLPHPPLQHPPPRHPRPRPLSSRTPPAWRAWPQVGGVRLPRGSPGLGEGEDFAGLVRVWQHRPPGSPRCWLSDSAAQHRERGGALVPPRSSQPTLHVI